MFNYILINSLELKFNFKKLVSVHHCLFTRCSRLFNRLLNRLNNRLYVNGWMLGCVNQTCWIHTTGWTTAWMFVYTIQPVVQPVVKPVWQPVVSCKRGLTVFIKPTVKTTVDSERLFKVTLLRLLYQRECRSVGLTSGQRSASMTS